MQVHFGQILVLHPAPDRSLRVNNPIIRPTSGLLHVQFNAWLYFRCNLKHGASNYGSQISLGKPQMGDIEPHQFQVEPNKR